MVSQWAALTFGKERELSGHNNFNSGDGERGPGWYDVAEGLRRLRRHHGSDLALRIEPSFGVNGRFGLRAVVYCEAYPHGFAYAGYGPAYPYGCKTFSATCWRAVFHAEQSEGVVEHLQNDMGLFGG